MPDSISVPLPSLGPADRPEHTLDDGKKRRNWYVPGVYLTDAFEEKLTNAYEPRLVELPVRTTWCVRKFEVGEEEQKLHANYCFSLPDARSFTDVRKWFTDMGFKNPELRWFNLKDKDTVAHNIDYTCKDHTAAPGILGQVVETGMLNNMTPRQWVESYKKKKERKATSSNDKKSAKEEARDLLYEYILDLKEWENLEDLKASAWTDKELRNVLSLYPQIAREIIAERDAHFRTIRRERKGIKILIGGAGALKSTRAMNDGKPEGMPSSKFTYKFNYEEKYQEYLNHFRILLEEFHSGCMPYDKFKDLTDDNNHGVAYEAPAKYTGRTTFNHAETWIVSNHDIPRWYHGVWRDPIALDAFLRRVYNAEVVMRWKVSDMNDPTSVIYDEDGTPVANRVRGDDISIQYLDITDKLKACRSLQQIRDLTLWYRDQLPHGHPLGLSDLDKTHIMGTAHYDEPPAKRPRTDNFGMFV